MVKKKLLSVTLVAVTVCSMIFTGCGNSAENTGNDTGKTDTDAQAGNTAAEGITREHYILKCSSWVSCIFGLYRKNEL